MQIPWHRFFKIGLRQLLARTCFEVHDEFDLSDQVQRVDFVIVRVGKSSLPYPDPAKMPDGLQNLREHNLISYKSMNEPFDRFALNELVGHIVSYSKLQSADKWKEFSDEVGFFAVSTRKPSTEVMAKLLHQTADEAIYEIDCAGWKVTCIVINEANNNNRNWLWELLRGDRSRWQNGAISTILKTITKRLKKMGIIDPEIEAFETKVIESWLEDIDLRKTPAGKELIGEGIEQGEEKIITKQIKTRFPNINDPQLDKICQLSSSDLEELAVELFDFQNLEDLDSWLKSR